METRQAIRTFRAFALTYETRRIPADAILEEGHEGEYAGKPKAGIISLELVKLATAERHAKARMALREHAAANQHEKATSQKSHGVHQKTPTETDGELSVPSASASVPCLIAL